MTAVVQLITWEKKDVKNKKIKIESIVLGRDKKERMMERHHHGFSFIIRENVLKLLGEANINGNTVNKY